MKQAHIWVSGHVQDVWYRKFVKTNAEGLGITGWVRNLPARQSPDGPSRMAGGPDNRVEAIIQGDKEVLIKLIELCHVGPQFAEVKNVEVVWEDEEEEFKDFIII